MNLLAALSQPSLAPPVGKKLSTGLSILNYALSGDVSYGLDSGSVVMVSGDTNSGRTTFGLTVLAEAAINVLFDQYTLVYFDTEGKAVDVRSYLGSKAADRIYMGAVNSLDAFWKYCSSAVKRVIVLDSLDGVLCPGFSSGSSWWTNNQCAKGVFDCIRSNSSILIITAQEKVIQSKKVIAGGYAPVFYSDFQLRLTYMGEYYKMRRKNRVSIGSNTSISVLKSKFDSPSRVECPSPIVVGYGYDNAVSLLTFLRRRGRVIERDGEYLFPEFGCRGDYNAMIRFCREYEQILAYKIKDWV